MDSRPVKDTFSIIHIIKAWCVDNKYGKLVTYREDYATTLSPESPDIYLLSGDELRNHIIIPEL